VLPLTLKQFCSRNTQCASGYWPVAATQAQKQDMCARVCTLAAGTQNIP